MEKLLPFYVHFILKKKGRSEGRQLLWAQHRSLYLHLHASLSLSFQSDTNPHTGSLGAPFIWLPMFSQHT